MFKRKSKILKNYVDHYKDQNKDQNVEKHEDTIQDIADTLNNIQESFHGAMMDKIRLAQIQAICGDASIEDRIIAATNYELGLRVMKKHLEDQLIYAGGGDESLISTIRFESVEEVCRVMLGMIDALLQANINDD